MLAVQNAVLGALQRAEPFLAENADALTSVDLTAVRKRVDDIIASFTTHAVEPNANDRDVKGESAKQQQLRLTLSTDVMRPIAENHAARSLAEPEGEEPHPPHGCNEGLRFQEQEGRSVLKVLDALVRRALRGNAALLGTWEGARTIRRRPGPTTTPSTTQITPTEAPATTPPVATAA